MKVPEEMKLDTNLAVVFKKPFEFGGTKCNAIVQQDDGTLAFFDTDYMGTNGEIRVAYKGIYKGINGGINDNGE